MRISTRSIAVVRFRILSVSEELGSKLSQRALADKMQLIGIDVDKNAIQRIECGKRFVTDIELKAFAEIFGVSLDKLVGVD